ncbi:MAG: DMT family transporter [Acetobacteraceae bacterium]|nr:DMT family transporter [Acetobacteraceae bacterium]
MAGRGAGSRQLGLLYLVATAIGWGLAWPAIKVLVATWPPLLARGLVGVIASLLLATAAAAMGERLGVAMRTMPRLLLASFTNVFAWMGFSTLSLTTLSTGEGALLVYTMPIWTTLFAWPLLGTKPTPRGIAALVLGFAGIVVLLGGQPVAMDGGRWAGVAFALGSASGFALGTVLNRTPLGLPPVAATAWQVGLGCLPMLLIGVVFEPPLRAWPGATEWALLVYMTLIPMAACFLTWFAALRRLAPGTAATGMLLAPLIGVTSGAMLLGEPFGPREMGAIALTFAGIVLALRSPRRG